MKFRSTKQKGETSIPLGLAIGIGVCALITLTGTITIAALVAKEAIAIEKCYIAILIVHFISVLVGTLTANHMTKRKIIPVSLALAGCYFIALLSMTAMFFGGQYHNIVGPLLSSVAGCFAADIFLVAGMKRHKNGIPKHAYR